VGKIYISGGIDGYQNLIDHIGNELGLPIGIIDPLSQEIPYVGQVSTPKTIPERAAFSPATGLALSDNSHTPSFLFTFKEKDKLSRIGRFNQFILLAFLLCAAVCLGIFFWQGEVAKQKQAQTDQVRQELAQYNPKVDQNFILQMAAQIKKKRQDLKALSRRHEASAIIGELTELTPDNIRLLSISTQLGRVLDEKIEPSKKRVVLEGLVSGSRYMLETSLTGYLLALANSPLFRRPTINKTRLESSEKGAALYFTLHLQVL
jgi:Tfp pilus assembly protein PilN